MMATQKQGENKGKTMRTLYYSLLAVGVILLACTETDNAESTFVGLGLFVLSGWKLDLLERLKD